MERRHPCRRFAGILPADLILSTAPRLLFAPEPRKSVARMLVFLVPRVWQIDFAITTLQIMFVQLLRVCHLYLQACRQRTWQHCQPVLPKKSYGGKRQANTGSAGALARYEREARNSYCVKSLRLSVLRTVRRARAPALPVLTGSFHIGSTFLGKALSTGLFHLFTP